MLVDAEVVGELVASVMKDQKTPDLIAELNDVGGGSRSHYATGTYASGCRGPLCSLAMQHKYAWKKFLRDCDKGRIKPDRTNETTNVPLTVFASRLLHEQNRVLPDHLEWIMREIHLDPVPPAVLSPGEKLFYRTIETDFLYAKWIHLLANKERIWPYDESNPANL